MVFEISLLSLILGASTVITGVSLIIKKEREDLENKHRAVAYENERLKNLIEERERFFKEKEESMEILNNERLIHLTEMKELISKSNPSEDHKKDLKKITDRFLDIAEKGAEDKARIVHNHNHLTSKGPFGNDLY